MPSHGWGWVFTDRRDARPQPRRVRGDVGPGGRPAEVSVECTQRHARSRARNSPGIPPRSALP
eukprot:scaffold1146_cov399-Prasinococcus_capsulatus_cf.AAC.60